MNKLKTAAMIGAGTAMVLMPALVLAQNNLATPNVPFGGDPLTLQDVEDIVRSIANFLILISIIIAVIFIVWGGIMYMMAGDDTAKSGAAKSRIVNGIIGALVVMAVGLILQTLAGVVDWNEFLGGYL